MTVDLRARTAPALVDQELDFDVPQPDLDLTPFMLDRRAHVPARGRSTLQTDPIGGNPEWV